MSNVVVVYHSGYGHTRVMAQAVAQGVERHLGSTCQLIPVEEVEDHWDRLHRADAIIFGAPTYMGSASAPFKAFMEATAAFYLAQPWRDKLAAGFTNSGSLCGDKLNTLLQLAVFAAQHSMIWVPCPSQMSNNLPNWHRRRKTAAPPRIWASGWPGWPNA